MDTSRRYRYRIGTLLLEVDASFDPLPQWSECQDEGCPQLLMRVRRGQLPPADPQALRIDTSNGPVWWRDGSFRSEDFLLVASPDYTRFNAMVCSRDISNVVAMVFALGGRGNLLIHSACVTLGGRGYAFLAPSGTGKSTHADNWVKAFPGCQLLNDDNPILSVDGGQVILHGSPWSGKRPVYIQRQVPLRALVRIVRAPENSIVRATAVDSLVMLMEAVSTLRREPRVYRSTLETVKQVLERVPCYTLRCLPDESSARLCRQEIEKL